MSLQLNAVQTAVFERLQTALAPVPILDAGAKINVPFPYVTVGAQTAAPANTLTEWGTEYLASVHCWSRYDGTREVNELMEAARAALEGQAFAPVPGVQWVGAPRWVEAIPLLELDGVTRHGIVRFQISTFQKQ